MGRVHQKRSREQLRQRRRLLEMAVEAYYGKLALLQTFEGLGIEDEDTRRLRNEVRKRRIMIENRGGL